jgi:hypothetical protein
VHLLPDPASYDLARLPRRRQQPARRSLREVDSIALDLSLRHAFGRIAARTAGTRRDAATANRSHVGGTRPRRRSQPKIGA